MSNVNFNQQVLAQLPLGVLLLDRDMKVVFWNQWLERQVGVAKQDAVGENFLELFPRANSARFKWAVNMVFEHKMSQILSQVLNQYIIPIKVMGMEPYGLHHMQQHIEIVPVPQDGGETLAMVCIIDVTVNVVKAAHAMEMADNLLAEEDMDSSTQLYNRRYMWQWLRQQFILGSKLSFSISVIMVELSADDHVADQMDLEVKGVVSVILKALRNSDCVMRFDDKKLVVLLPSCELKDARVVAETLSGRLQEQSNLPNCCFGVSSWSKASPCTGEELIKMSLHQLRCSKAAASNLD